MNYFNILTSCLAFSLLLTPVQTTLAKNASSAPFKKKSVQIAKTKQADALGLKEALREVYQNNPEINAARAELLATDETYAQAIAGFRPSVTGEAAYASTRKNGSVSTQTHADEKSLSLQVTQPIFSGGSTLSDVKAADQTILAQRALLRAIEQSVLLKAVTAYMNTLRDKEIVLLNTNNETVLKKQLQATKERFRLGTVTKTAVSQAQSRLAAATAARIAAAGDLKVSMAGFESVIGLAAGELETPKSLTELPPTLDAALTEAEKNNPDILHARHIFDAAQARTRSIIGETLPQIGLTGAVARTLDPADMNDGSQNNGSVTLTATIPLYTGGATYSRIRESRHSAMQKRLDITKAERDMREQVIDAWETLSSSRAEVAARKAQMSAAKLARNGVQAETDYGTGTVLDLLDAEQEYLEARVSHLIASHNEIISGYGLLAAMGQLAPDALALDVPVYDSLKNLEKIKGLKLETTTRVK